MVVMHEPCPECEGSGWIFATYCCNGCEYWGDRDPDEWGVLAECGHRIARVDEVPCPRCSGRGAVGIVPGLAALGLEVPETLEEALAVIERLLHVIDAEVELRESTVRLLLRRLERERYEKEVSA